MNFVNRKFLIITYIRDDLRSIGVKYVFASAKNQGIDVKLLYINVDDKLNELALKNFFDENNFGVVGINVMTRDFYYTVNLTKLIDKISPHTFVFWGGIHPTCEPEECLEYVNCICIGEGEKSAIDIVNHYENLDALNETEGVGFRKLAVGGGVISYILNRPAYIENINELPSPQYEFNNNFFILDSTCSNGTVRSLALTDYAKYSRHNGDGYALITSRSCPNNCSYCINSFFNKIYSDRGKNRFFRRRSVQKSLEEIKYALKTIPSVRFINFLDDHFLVDKDWLEEFINQYGKEIGLPFIIRSTPEYITEEIVVSLKKVGLNVIQMGIQSGCSETHRKIFHRKFNREKIIEAAKIISKHQIVGMYDFIIGNEFETVEEKKLTIELMMELPKPYIANVFHIIPFPKTDIVQWYKKNNIKPKLNPYRETYMDCRDDFFSMLAMLVPVTDNDTIRYFLDNMDKPECFSEVRQRYENLNNRS